MNELLNRTLQANKEKYINRLLKLVEIDTRDIGHGIEGGLEGNGQKYLIDVFKELGADEILTDQLREEIIQKSMELYNEGNPGHNYDNRYNVYASFKGKGGRSIMFNGHIDNLPAENEEGWDNPPLQPVVKDGKMYGIGICDMKSGLMASVMAVELLKDAGVKLPGDVKIVSVVDEEGGGNGSITAAMNGQRADAVVVCEPTNHELIAAHMGFVFFKVEVSGIAVHSGLKLSGISAIEKAVKIITAIDGLEHKWLLKYKHPLLPPPSSNVGVIYGGETGSTIPDYCCFKTCVHYHPNQMNYDQVVDEYTNAIKLCCAGDEWLKDHMPKISIYQSGGSFEMDLEHEFVGVFKSAYKSAMNREVKVVGSPAGCDSRTWRNIAKCPTLQYGPGSLEQCHTVNEYVTVEQYLNAILVYANLILEWCER